MRSRGFITVPIEIAPGNNWFLDVQRAGGSWRPQWEVTTMATIPVVLLTLSAFGLMFNVQRSRHMRLLQSMLPRADDQTANTSDGAGRNGVVMNSAAGCLLTIVRQLMQGKFLSLVGALARRVL